MGSICSAHQDISRMTANLSNESFSFCQSCFNDDAGVRSVPHEFFGRTFLDVLVLDNGICFGRAEPNRENQ